MTQTFWKSMVFAGLAFVLLAGGIEIYQWVTAHF